ncbi:MAG: archaeosortase/exosortase family protein [Bryobacteraceae bacterium]|nr:archaeosortase/exosortase family protein [Bryobacteraceae bacterium]
MNPLRALASLAWNDERYTYLLAVPVLGAGMIVLERGRIFAVTKWSFKTGALAVLLSLTVWLAAVRWSAGLGPVEGLSLYGAAAALAWIAGFGFCFGTAAVKAAAFPLAFLLLMAPIPEFLMHKAEVALQYGSADVTHVLMKLAGMTFFREGLTFSLPGLNIEVAEECSGIRSSTVFWITAAAAGYMFLRSAWSRLALIVLTVPILVFKNAVRITTLSWLGVNVSQDVLHGDLHRQGGVPFGLIAIALLIPSVVVIRKLEDRTRRGEAR